MLLVLVKHVEQFANFILFIALAEHVEHLTLLISVEHVEHLPLCARYKIYIKNRTS